MKKKTLLKALLALPVAGSLVVALGSCNNKNNDSKPDVVDESTSGNNQNTDARVTNIYINQKGEMVATLSNGKQINLGVVKGSNGTNGADGENGTDGVGITNIKLDEAGNLIITLSDNQELNLGSIIGANGANGADGENGIDGLDGRDGIDGIDGERGADGENGADGADGADGIGVASVTINAEGKLVVVLTDNTELVLGTVVGANGADYVKKDFTITLNDVEENNTITVKEGETADLPKLTKDGYKFLGWFTEDDVEVTSLTGIFKDLTLNPKFELLEEYAVITVNGVEMTVNKNATFASLFPTKNSFYAIVASSVNNSLNNYPYYGPISNSPTAARKFAIKRNDGVSLYPGDMYNRGSYYYYSPFTTIGEVDDTLYFSTIDCNSSAMFSARYLRNYAYSYMVHYMGVDKDIVTPNFTYSPQYMSGMYESKINSFINSDEFSSIASKYSNIYLTDVKSYFEEIDDVLRPYAIVINKTIVSKFSGYFVFAENRLNSFLKPVEKYINNDVQITEESAKMLYDYLEAAENIDFENARLSEILVAEMNLPDYDSLVLKDEVSEYFLNQWNEKNKESYSDALLSVINSFYSLSDRKLTVKDVMATDNLHRILECSEYYYETVTDFPTYRAALESEYKEYVSTMMYENTARQGYYNSNFGRCCSMYSSIAEMYSFYIDGNEEKFDAYLKKNGSSLIELFTNDFKSAVKYYMQPSTDKLMNLIAAMKKENLSAIVEAYSKASYQAPRGVHDDHIIIVNEDLKGTYFYFDYDSTMNTYTYCDYDDDDEEASDYKQYIVNNGKLVSLSNVEKKYSASYTLDDTFTEDQLKMLYNTTFKYFDEEVGYYIYLTIVDSKEKGKYTFEPVVDKELTPEDYFEGYVDTSKLICNEITIDTKKNVISLASVSKYFKYYAITYTLDVLENDYEYVYVPTEDGEILEYEIDDETETLKLTSIFTDKAAIPFFIEDEPIGVVKNNVLSIETETSYVINNILKESILDKVFTSETGDDKYITVDYNDSTFNFILKDDPTTELYEYVFTYSNIINPNFKYVVDFDTYTLTLKKKTGADALEEKYKGTVLTGEDDCYSIYTEVENKFYACYSITEEGYKFNYISSYYDGSCCLVKVDYETKTFTVIKSGEYQSFVDNYKKSYKGEDFGNAYIYKNGYYFTYTYEDGKYVFEKIVDDEELDVYTYSFADIYDDEMVMVRKSNYLALPASIENENVGNMLITLDSKRLVKYVYDATAKKYNKAGIVEKEDYNAITDSKFTIDEDNEISITDKSYNSVYNKSLDIAKDTNNIYMSISDELFAKYTYNESKYTFVEFTTTWYNDNANMYAYVNGELQQVVIDASIAYKDKEYTCDTEASSIFVLSYFCYAVFEKVNGKFVYKTCVSKDEYNPITDTVYTADSDYNFIAVIPSYNELMKNSDYSCDEKLSGSVYAYVNGYYVEFEAKDGKAKYKSASLTDIYTNETKVYCNYNNSRLIQLPDFTEYEELLIEVCEKNLVVEYNGYEMTYDSEVEEWIVYVLDKQSNIVIGADKNNKAVILTIDNKVASVILNTYEIEPLKYYPVYSTYYGKLYNIYFEMNEGKFNKFVDSYYENNILYNLVFENGEFKYELDHEYLYELVDRLLANNPTYEGLDLIKEDTARVRICYKTYVFDYIYANKKFTHDNNGSYEMNNTTKYYNAELTYDEVKGVKLAIKSCNDDVLDFTKAIEGKLGTDVEFTIGKSKYCVQKIVLTEKTLVEFYASKEAPSFGCIYKDGKRVNYSRYSSDNKKSFYMNVELEAGTYYFVTQVFMVQQLGTEESSSSESSTKITISVNKITKYAKVELVESEGNIV